MAFQLLFCAGCAIRSLLEEEENLAAYPFARCRLPALRPLFECWFSLTPLATALPLAGSLAQFLEQPRVLDEARPYCAFGVSDGLAAGTVPAGIAPFSFFFLFFLFFLLFFFFFFSSVFGVSLGCWASLGSWYRQGVN
jgi:hypothetical protein